MKKIILLLAMVSGAIGTGLFAGSAQASGYWDYSMGQRGVVFSASHSTEKAECEAEKRPCQESAEDKLDLNDTLPSNDSLELEDLQGKR